ncbi:hypothetical protein KUTeg_002540 [Tegillarca granosa]|uniref:Innexin n=1 Tax=Tegillarca granosa TaxID=220873 RepID=A0ABQ9FZ33_TEGGR|nr:hypothetical protein KUTeg_002540 [Tegillarca granosa]
MMDHVLGTVGATVGLKSVYDDDFIDRLSHYYSVIIIIVFTVIISTNQYVGNPIECWCPADFTENRVYYTNFVCWVSNTYYVPFSRQIPVDPTRRQEKELTYYQWVPLILLFMAMLFKIPRMIWKMLSASSGICIDKLVYIARETMTAAPEEREKKLRHIVKYMDQWLENVREDRAGLCVRLRRKIGRVCALCGRHYGNYLVTVVLIVKAFYVANAVSQLFILNLFLGTEYNVYGFEVIESLIKGDDWTASPRFPRITLCDFEIRQMVNVQRWTVQCVLPINLFNEKIFIFLWFWLVFMAMASAFGLIISTYSVIFPQHRKSYVRKYLKLINQYKKTKDDRQSARKFMDSYLRQDGVYVLRAISNNANDVICTELVKYLYKNYKEKRQTPDDNSA